MNKSNHNLDHLLSPKTIAIVGASTKPNSFGLAILEMLTNGKFSGNIYPINPKYKKKERKTKNRRQKQRNKQKRKIREEKKTERRTMNTKKEE